MKIFRQKGFKEFLVEKTVLKACELVFQFSLIIVADEQRLVCIIVTLFVLILFFLQRNVQLLKSNLQYFPSFLYLCLLISTFLSKNFRFIEQLCGREQYIEGW